MNPKWLLLAPPCVWSLIGLIALLAPHELGRLFPILWPLNDIGIMMGATGLILLLFRTPGPVGPTLDEWTDGSAPEAESDLPLEELLARLARALDEEFRGLT